MMRCESSSVYSCSVVFMGQGPPPNSAFGARGVAGSLSLYNYQEVISAFVFRSSKMNTVNNKIADNQKLVLSSFIIKRIEGKENIQRLIANYK